MNWPAFLSVWAGALFFVGAFAHIYDHNRLALGAMFGAALSLSLALGLA